jgi:predicted adenylyl cyclase CyaB
MSRNIELKARLADLDAARRVAQRIATSSGGTLHQIDTYFHVPVGRLKLREIAGERAELIAYHRANSPAARASDYTIVPVPDAGTLTQALAAVLGIRTVVRKVRELWFYQNVRIHLDQVRELGTFLEFEAVLSDGKDDASGRAQLDWLCGHFGIDSRDIVPQSYSDLLLAHQPYGR